MESGCPGAPRVPDELADSLGWLLARTGQLVGAALSHALADLGTTPRELSVLMAAAPCPRPQLGLAAVVGLDKTTMVATVDALERRGLVRRELHPHDRRMRMVTVTESGQQLTAQAAAAASGMERRVLSVLPVRDRERLLPLLRALVEGAPGGPPSGSCV
jgi:DNA-binding MarR family transcriptional regulator